MFRFPSFPGKVEKKKCYGTLLRLLNIFRNVVHIMIRVLGFYKKILEAIGELPNNLVFIFQVENGLHGKTWNISGTMEPIFFILSPYFWENNRLLNKNYWDDLAIVDLIRVKVTILLIYRLYLDQF